MTVMQGQTGRRRPGRLFLASIMLLAIMVAGARANAASPDEAAALPKALLHLHVDGLATLEHQELVQDLLAVLSRSGQFEQALQSAELIQLTEGLQFVSAQMGEDPAELIRKLTAEGVDATMSDAQPPQWVLAFTTVDEDFADRMVLLLSRLAAPEGVRKGEHRGVTGYALGKVSLAAHGRRLLVASQSDTLKAAVDRILDGVPGSNERVAPKTDAGWHASARVNLERFRKLPDVEKGLRIPAEDAGLVAFLGSWVDALRRHDLLSVEVSLDDAGVASRVLFSEPNAPPLPALSAYDDATKSGPAPLLKVPQTIYSATWTRDYARLWDNRDTLLISSTRERLERQDREVAAQFEALGAPVGFSDVAQQLGTNFRVVVAAQDEPPYDISLADRLPAAALVVELKDEQQFDTLVRPLLRAIGIVITFEQGVLTEESDYSGARLTSLALPTTDEALRRRSRGDYNFRTTYAITQGHMIIGTTPGIVRAVIDELESIKSNNGKVDCEPGTTSQQILSGSQLLAGLEPLQEAILRHSVLQDGLDVPQAEHELEVARSLITLFEQARAESRAIPDGVEYGLELTRSVKQAPAQGAAR